MACTFSVTGTSLRLGWSTISTSPWRVTKGAGSRAAGLAMAFKLVEAAQARWRRVNASHLVPLVRAGARFIDGQLQEIGHVSRYCRLATLRRGGRDVGALSGAARG